MKYIRLFEDNQKSPKIGDYAIIRNYYPNMGIYNKYYTPLYDYFMTHIGIITKVFFKVLGDAKSETVYLKYENPPEEIRELLMKHPDVAVDYDMDDDYKCIHIRYACVYAKVNNLKYFGTKEEVELQMSMENYNL